MLRPSTYAIAIKLADSSRTLLVQGYTGVGVEIDSSWAERIGFNTLTPAPPAEIDSATALSELARTEPGLIEALREGQLLTELSPEQERAHVRQLAETVRAQSHPSAGTAFWLVPTYGCNLRCSYCYMFFPPPGAPRPMQLRVVMSESLVDAAFAAMKAMAPENPLRTVFLVGGEPLLSKNRSIIRHITQAAQAADYNLFIFSNGVQLDSFLPLLSASLVKAIQVSLDGPPAVHNQRRAGPLKRPTFDAIVRNVGLALEQGFKIKLRVNVDESNMEATPELATLIDRMGWFERSNFTAAFALTEQSRVMPHEFASFLERHAAHPSLRRVAFNRGLTRDVLRPLLEHHQLQPRVCYCARELGALIFDPLGNIYDCANTIGYEAHCVGRYGPGRLELFQSRIEFNRNRLVTNIPECASCAFLFMCGGGCSAQSTGYQSSATYRPHCADIKEAIVDGILRTYPRLKSYEFLCSAKRADRAPAPTGVGKGA